MKLEKGNDMGESKTIFKRLGLILIAFILTSVGLIQESSAFQEGGPIRCCLTDRKGAMMLTEAECRIKYLGWWLPWEDCTVPPAPGL